MARPVRFKRLHPPDWLYWLIQLTVYWLLIHHCFLLVLLRRPLHYLLRYGSSFINCCIWPLSITHSLLEWFVFFSDIHIEKDNGPKNQKSAVPPGVLIPDVLLDAAGNVSPRERRKSEDEYIRL